MLISLPVELLLHVGRYLRRRDLISLARTSKGIRKTFMKLIFGGTVYIRSPLEFFPGLLELFDYLQEGMPGLQKCIDQVAFYRHHGDLARSVHIVQIADWIVPGPQLFWLTVSGRAEWDSDCRDVLEKLKSNQDYIYRSLMQFRSVYDSILVYLVQFLPISELQLIRSHITPIVHRTLHTMPTLRRLSLEDCTTERFNFQTYAGHGGRYELFKATAGEQTYLTWGDTSGPNTLGTFIQVYLSSCSTLTKLEICIEFFEGHDDALDHLSLPSLKSLAIVPRMEFDINDDRWSWGTVYRVLKSSPNITCFRFELLDVLYPFSETTSDWKEYKRRIGNLPLSQLSSITAYRQLAKRLVPRRPVSFLKILLFSNPETREFNWPEPESDDEVNDGIGHFKERYIVPYQLVRSATPIKTLYLQRIEQPEFNPDPEQPEFDPAIWAEGIEFLRDACPYLTDLWLPSLKTTSRTSRYRDPVVMVEVLDELRIWDMTLEWCAVGSCSPCPANEREWHREGTIVRQRVHPTLKELLLGADVLWKWQDNFEATGWVLYISTEGSEDSEETSYSPSDSRYADYVLSLGAGD